MARDTWAPVPEADQVPLHEVTDWVDAVAAADDGLDGITISGGEPFDQPEALGALVCWLRARFDPAHVDLLVYTGYRKNLVLARHAGILGSIDALITEPYRQRLDTQLRWRGSANQQLVMLSELGRERYAEHVAAAADTPVQIDVRDGGVQLIGVPRPGDLARLEEALARRGVALDGCSWTP
jgi:anaerobic ribonucleoside-triphosphate reductase activating protein